MALTHELQQDIVSYPLTMRTRVPQDWNGARIMQNGTVLDIEVQELDEIRYAVYDIVLITGRAIVEKNKLANRAHLPFLEMCPTLY